MNDYKIYKSKIIIENHKEFVILCEELDVELREEFSIGVDNSTTWEYNRYGLFNLKQGNKLFDSLKEELIDIIKENYKDECWFTSWLNFDTYDTVEHTLKKHFHESPLHGYISIDPKNTKTNFPYSGFVVDNEIGNIYIGPGGGGPGNDIKSNKWKHEVINTSDYEGNRITIAFDVVFTHPKTQSYRWFKVN